ncbi:EthD family reductase [Herbiconiux sp. CPCC 203407]|uniref:EthD family reductase n=1 Tax=Herbiconiux oxytropis TaxID=2970915 RepID=A0AA41XKB3_9MICO|nr:EthD family reductase [Herbiconiux oxytropis]MCS5723430.1 EthD family reductase [Herbiconiux oxytropis]MCS5727923.1 EthD family reductase [Herbiconiux oxytropis]
MTTKIEIIIDNLDDTQAFERALPDLLEKARALPGLRSLESSRVWPKDDGTPTPAFRTLSLAFDGYDEASGATSSPEGQAFFGAVVGATGGKITGLFLDVEPA